MISWISLPGSNARSFVFLDRDGVVNMDRKDYIKRWSEVRFYPDALEALRWLREHEIGVILISNQSALHRGFMAWEDFWDIHHRMIAAIRDAGGELLGAFYCPHRPDERCDCRKPAPGLILAAATMLDISPATTYMIGNRLTDTAAAANAGCPGVLLNRADELGKIDEGPTTTTPHRRYETLFEAVTALFARGESLGE
jgi:D-glycero-D-manno-heptose 1,7-bisphosphate phosphatase